MLLAIEHLSKSFGAVQALRDVTFSCAAGEIHGLVGENGAGKSTLLKILAGVHAPDDGEIRLEGQLIRIFRPGASARCGITIIHQEFSLIPALTVAESIYIGHERPERLGRLNRKAMREDARQLLTRVGLSIDPDRRIDTLTVAEQQAVEIARALSLETRLLILDEPTAALADQEVERLLGILYDVRAAGTGVIFVSHRLYEVLAIADSITVLKDGRVIGTDSVANMDEPRLISMMVGRELAQAFPPRAAAKSNEALLRVENFCAADRSFEDVSLQLQRGEILGIAGLEGHGQRELLRALFGLDPLAHGTLRMQSHTLGRLTPHRCIRRGIAFVSDDRKGEGLILPFDIRENVCLATMKQRQTLSFINRAAEKRIARSIVKRLDVHPPQIERLVRYLSGGNQQKIVLGKWLVAQPRVLLLCEPTRGIDVGTKVEIYVLLRELADEGLGIIMVSRDMIELLGLSDRVLVMADGRVVEELEGAAATEEAVMRAIVRGGSSRVQWRDSAARTG